MKKKLANIITLCRILGSIGMLFFSAFSVCFYGLYLFCGFTDMIDGTIARITKSAGKFGAMLDSMADIAFASAAFLKVLPAIHIQEYLWIWIAAIAVLRICNCLLAFVRWKKILFLHTLANKLTGLALFLLPLSLPFVNLQFSAAAVCALATFAAIQEGYCILSKNDPL